MKTKDDYIQGYNVQAAFDSDHKFIVASTAQRKSSMICRRLIVHRLIQSVISTVGAVKLGVSGAPIASAVLNLSPRHAPAERAEASRPARNVRGKLRLVIPFI